MNHWFDMFVGVMVGGYFVALGLGAKVQPEALRGKKAFAGFGVFIMLCGFAMLFVEKNLDNIPLGMTAQQVVDAIKKQAQFPVTIDPMMRLDAVEAGENRVIYRYTLGSSSLLEFKDTVDKMRGEAKKDGCTLSSNKRMLISGIAIENHYAMLSGPTTEPIVISPQACGYQVKPANNGVVK